MAQLKWETHMRDSLRKKTKKMAAHRIKQMDQLMKKAVKKSHDAEKYVINKFNGVWELCNFHSLPKWLQDNDYLISGHRPPLESFKECFWSIFRVHTETINIWTHAIGCFIFLILASYFMYSSHPSLSWVDKGVFFIFFAGAITCLGLSACYHTLSCHSPKVGKLFTKLDYVGIASLITGSFIPWLYYGFYCDYYPKLCYTILTSLLCVCTIIVSLCDKFSEPAFRPFRAIVFMTFGLSGIFPGIHWLINWSHDYFTSVNLRSSFNYLLLMGLLYIIGTLLYALRIPERFFPGKCDLWFHSHQIFHVFVIIAAIVHYRSISELAFYHVNNNICYENNI